MNIPVLKAWNRVLDFLKCIDAHPYDRQGFQDCIMKLFPDRLPKSVFRGMAIPTMRSLGLIVGYDDVIRISANGALLNLVAKDNLQRGLRVLRVILHELDQEIGMLDYLSDLSETNLEELVSKWVPLVNIPELKPGTKEGGLERSSRERILDWINFLVFSGLLYNYNKVISVNKLFLSQTRDDSEAKSKAAIFERSLFPCYHRIVVGQTGINTVEIEALRKEMALDIYKQAEVIMTEQQFDKLLEEFPKATDRYTITFGRSMGADEKLFLYKGRYFQTIFVRFSD